MISITFKDLSPTQANLLVRFYAAQSGEEFNADCGSVTQTMTGQDYIDSMDNPETGAELAPSAASVFTAGHIAAASAPVVDVTPPVNVASAFGASPVRQMTLSAGDFTYDQYIGMGWNDQQLIDAGYLLAPAPPAPPPRNDGNPPNVPAAVAGTPPAPPATVSTPPAPPSGHSITGAAALLDAEGIAWDGRIHSGGRTQTKACIWTAKKGVDAALVAQVKAEQRGTQGGVPFTPLSPSTPPPPNGMQGNAPSQPPPTGSPGTPSSPTQSHSDGTPANFTALCSYITRRALGTKIVPICEKYGMAGLGMMAQQSNFDAFIEPMFADLQAL